MTIFVNRRCFTGCASCSAGASPTNTDELSIAWLQAFFQNVKDLTFPGYIIWTGGEPFLSIDSLDAGLKLASEAGYHSEILTGGEWFATHPEYLNRLSGYRRLSLRISIDAEHQARVPVSQLIDLIRDALTLNLEVNFTRRDIPGVDSIRLSFEAISRALPEFYLANYKRSRWIHSIPHIPFDNPLDKASEVSEISKIKSTKSCPMAFRDLIIGEDGLIYPCCGLFRLPIGKRQQLALGDPLTDSWDTICARQTHHAVSVWKEKNDCGLCNDWGMKGTKT
ncbi:MAG: hypothetical protein ACM3SY_14045 [Candidatus Omnitrophota bacterium]